MKKYDVAIVGATGMVGRMFLKVLEEREFPINNLYAFASSKSKGTKITYNGNECIVEELNENSFNRHIDIALFSAGANVSRKYSPIAVSKGVTVVDNSSAFRMDKNVPLVVPEVNPQDINWHKGIIANPNCSTIQAVVALKPLYDKYGIKRVVYSTYQSVSGSGVKGINDLTECLAGNRPKAYPHTIADNCLPHIDVFMDNGYTKEEIKMIEETRKIIGDDSLRITGTTVRVPVMYSHSESINVEFRNDFELDELRSLLSSSPGIVLQDDPSSNLYPLATNAYGRDEVFIGRIRRDYSLKYGLNMWVVADNIRKGAATNTVQIAELLISNRRAS